VTENMIPDAALVPQDPCGDKLVGDSFIAPVGNVLQPVVLCEAQNGQGQRCSRREHPAQWQHFAIVDNRITAAWRTSDGKHRQGVTVAELLAAAARITAAENGGAVVEAVDPLAHVRVGDPDPLIPEDDGDWLVCGAQGPSVFEIAGTGVRNSCDREQGHPPLWQHIAVDLDEVVEVWHGDHRPAQQPPLPAVVPVEDAPAAGEVEALIVEQSTPPGAELFDDARLAHVSRAHSAAVRVESGLMDPHRREVIANVFRACGGLPPAVVAVLPEDLRVSLELAMLALCEPLAQDTVALVEAVTAGAVQ
jgi:hypothetical protein